MKVCGIRKQEVEIEVLPRYMIRQIYQAWLMKVAPAEVNSGGPHIDIHQGMWHWLVHANTKFIDVYGSEVDSRTEETYHAFQRIIKECNELQ